MLLFTKPGQVELSGTEEELELEPPLDVLELAAPLELALALRASRICNASNAPSKTLALTVEAARATLTRDANVAGLKIMAAEFRVGKERRSNGRALRGVHGSSIYGHTPFATDSRGRVSS